MANAIFQSLRFKRMKDVTGHLRNKKIYQEVARNKQSKMSFSNKKGQS